MKQKCWEHASITLFHKFHEVLPFIFRVGKAELRTYSNATSLSENTSFWFRILLILAKFGQFRPRIVLISRFESNPWNLGMRGYQYTCYFHMFLIQLPFQIKTRRSQYKLNYRAVLIDSYLTKFCFRKFNGVFMGSTTEYSRSEEIISVKKFSSVILKK